MSKLYRVLMLVLTLAAGVLAAIQPVNQATAAPYPFDYNSPMLIIKGTASIKPVTYVVKQGDSLAKIAPEFKLAWQSLYCENKKLIGSNPNVISPGERILIPVKKVTCKIVLPAVNSATQQYTSASAPAQTTSVISSLPQATGTLQSYALELVGGNEQQFSCLNSIINTESSWNVTIENASSGAYGIPQALPGSKMSVAGYDWATNGETQLRWMINYYINPVYGSACNAWTFHLAHGWY